MSYNFDSCEDFLVDVTGRGMDADIIGGSWIDDATVASACSVDNKPKPPEECPDGVNGVYFNGDTDRLTVPTFGTTYLQATFQAWVRFKEIQGNQVICKYSRCI